MVKIDSFNGRNWFTYGINFSSKNLNSLVSGALCGDNEVIFVLVSDFSTFDKNKNEYTNILNTFNC